jgi:hypothetical protein
MSPLIRLTTLLPSRKTAVVCQDQVPPDGFSRVISPSFTSILSRKDITASDQNTCDELIVSDFRKNNYSPYTSSFNENPASAR